MTGSRSALIVTLEQLKLTELREIARRRGWQIGARTKAAYAQRMAPLLCDMTEVARAVTSLSDQLVQALQAAFIVEGGSGITPDALARVLSGLTGLGSGSVKPVEALALSSDLAQLGLVFPWRDLASGPRYLFPSEVQKAVPPLPGWCDRARGIVEPPADNSAPAPLLPVLGRVRHQIAECAPPLRSPPDAVAEKRLRSVLSDWPFDPAELESWRAQAGSGRHSPTGLSVPPVAYLLADDHMRSLASGAQLTIEMLELALRLLVELGLASASDGRLRASNEPWERFVARSENIQQADTTQAFLSLLDWSSLDVALRCDTRLVLMRTVGSAHSFAHFRSRLRALRHYLLRFLATAGDGHWCSLEAVLSALQVAWPLVLPRPEHGFPSRQYREGQTPWYVAWRESRLPLQANQKRGWDAGQGQLVLRLLEGPLQWLGLVDVSYDRGRMASIRTRRLADLLWNRPLPSTDHAVASEPLLVDEDDHTITAYSRVLPAEVLFLLAQVATLTKASPTFCTFRLDMRRAHAAFSHTPLPDLLKRWDQLVPVRMPAYWQDRLEDWWRRYGQIHIYEGLALLELSDEFALREIEATTSLGEHIIARLSPRFVALRDSDADALLDELASKGYMPSQQHHESNDR